MIKNTLSLLFMIFVFGNAYTMGSQSQSNNVPRTESELLAELNKPSFNNLPAEVQFKIFESLLDISEDKKIDDAVAKYSRISHKFYDIAHSTAGEKIINERRSRGKLQPLQNTIKSIIPTFNIDLVDQGVNATNDLGDTTLIAIATCIRWDYRLIKAANDLIFYGADIDTQNKYGSTALIMAGWTRNDPIGSLLLRSGANPNLQNDQGKTALMCYMMSKQSGTAKYDTFFHDLVTHSDLYIQDNENRIALGYALKIQTQEEESNSMSRNGEDMFIIIENEMKKDKKRYARYMMEKTLIID